MKNRVTQALIEDIVAQAYSAIARPESVIELLAPVAGLDIADAGSSVRVDNHLSNAAQILDQMYPLSPQDLGALDPRTETGPDCDLVMDGHFRVEHVTRSTLTDTSFAVGEQLPEWALDSVERGGSERDRLPRDAKPGLVRLYCSEEDETGSWFMVRREDGDDGSRFLFFALRMQWDEAHGLSFQEALGLSDVEAMLLRHLVRGGTLRSFAERRGRSIGTVRNQMKVLQRKLAVRSKEEVLLLYAGFASTLEDAAANASQPAHRCRNLLRTDSSTIAWEEMGDPDGKPVVFFHPLEGAILPNSAEREMRQAGLRIIAPWRPHHGATAGIGFGLDAIAQFAKDVSALLDHLAIDEAIAFATQAGAPYMIGCLAKARPGVFRQAFGFGAFLPVQSAQEFAMIPRSHRLSITAVRTAPAFARMYQRGMLASIGSGSFHRFVENFYEGHALELAAVRHPELTSVFRRSASYALAKGIDGPIDTMQCWASDWSELFEGLEVPLSLVYGSKDANMPRPLVEAVSGRLGLTRAQYVDGAGSFLLMDESETIARLLSEA